MCLQDDAAIPDRKQDDDSNAEAQDEDLEHALGFLRKYPSLVLDDPPLLQGFTHLMIAAATCDHEVTKAILDFLPEQVNTTTGQHHFVHLLLLV